MADEYSRRTLEQIEKKRERCNPFISSTQNVCCADVARADVAHVAEACCARQNKTEWDRAQQVA